MHSPRKAGPLLVGVLSLHNSAETKAICNAVTELGHTPVWIRREDFSWSVQDGTIEIEPSVDVLCNRLLLTKSDRPIEEIEVLGLFERTVPTLNGAEAVSRAIHKVRAASVLADAGIPVPDAYFAISGARLQDCLDNLEGRAVHKAGIGTNGQRMEAVQSSDAIPPRIQGWQSFLQSFVETDGERPSDVRVYVVDGEALGAMRRTAAPDEWRSNVARGSSVEDVSDSLKPAAYDLAIDSTAALGLDYAGVDLICSANEWYVLEVNATAGFKGFRSATGINPAAAIARTAIERAGGQVDTAALAAVREEFDTSPPDTSYRQRTERDTETPTIGYTADVTVSGTDGRADAVGKVDTGTRRTSIDTKLAGEIGVGPIVGHATVRNGSGIRRRPLVEVSIGTDSSWHSVEANISDRSGMRYPVLLGRDVLTDYRIDLSRRAAEE